MTREELRELCEERNLTERQIEVAKEALAHGLTGEEIEYVCRPEYSAEQMEQAVLAFEDWCSKDEVDIFYQKEISPARMLAIRQTFPGMTRPKSKKEHLQSVLSNIEGDLKKSGVLESRDE